MRTILYPRFAAYSLDYVALVFGRVLLVFRGHTHVLCCGNRLRFRFGFILRTRIVVITIFGLWLLIIVAVRLLGNVFVFPVGVLHCVASVLLRMANKTVKAQRLLVPFWQTVRVSFSMRLWCPRSIHYGSA